MKKIAVSNRKGGVGKSTISSQISYGLAYLGYRTLLLSADSQNDSGKILGVYKEDLIKKKDLKALLSNTASREDVIINIRENLDMIYTENLGRLNSFLAEEKRVEKMVEIGLDSFSEFYDFMIIDTSPSDSKINDCLLVYADSIIVPVETSYLSSSAIEEMFDYVSQLREDLSKIKLIIPNKYRKVVKKHNEHLQAIKEIFKDTETKVLSPIPIRSEIEKAGEEGLSIFETKSDIQEIFGEILKEVADL